MAICSLLVQGGGSSRPLEAAPQRPLRGQECKPAQQQKLQPERPSLRALHRADLYHVNGYSNKEVGTLAKTQGHAKCIRQFIVL